MKALAASGLALLAPLCAVAAPATPSDACLRIADAENCDGR